MDALRLHHLPRGLPRDLGHDYRFSQARVPRHTCLPRVSASLCVKFMEHVLATDFDFALVLAGLCEIVGQLHP